jgi:phosphonate transport system substrate-binding protein
VRSDLDPEAKRRLAVFLTTLKSQEPDIYDLIEHRHAGGFVRVSAAAYSTALAVVRSAEEGVAGKAK